MTKKHVLLIDDDSRNIFALTAILKAKSVSSISFTDARDAIKMMEENQDTPLDAILIDMMMPEMDGYEAIPLIRKINGRKNIPIIAVTALAMIGDKEKCLQAGADYYISKPIDIDKLIEVLNTPQ